MQNIWFLLIWLTVVAIEGLLYSILVYYLPGEHCSPVRISNELDSFFKFFDRFSTYQSWFIPMIYLYWPTKQRKEENRSRIKAVRTLTAVSARDLAGRVQGDDDDEFDDDQSNAGYSSLDGESYLDN